MRYVFLGIVIAGALVYFLARGKYIRMAGLTAAAVSAVLSVVI